MTAIMKLGMIRNMTAKAIVDVVFRGCSPKYIGVGNPFLRWKQSLTIVNRGNVVSLADISSPQDRNMKYHLKYHECAGSWPWLKVVDLRKSQGSQGSQGEANIFSVRRRCAVWFLASTKGATSCLAKNWLAEASPKLTFGKYFILNVYICNTSFVNIEKHVCRLKFGLVNIRHLNTLDNSETIQRCLTSSLERMQQEASLLGGRSCIVVVVAAVVVVVSVGRAAGGVAGAAAHAAPQEELSPSWWSGSGWWSRSSSTCFFGLCLLSLLIHRCFYCDLLWWSQLVSILFACHWTVHVLHNYR